MNYKYRKQYRLPYYSYAGTGLYFVTICTHNRKHLFGDVDDGVMKLSSIGKIAGSCWENIPSSSPYANIDSFVVMPNHVHGIIALDNPDGKHEIDKKKFKPELRSLSIVVRNYKAAVSIRVKEKYPNIVIWQSRFFDRIIRDERELYAIRKYIDDNPLQWHEDKNNPDNLMM